MGVSTRQLTPIKIEVASMKATQRATLPPQVCTPVADAREGAGFSKVRYKMDKRILLGQFSIFLSGSLFLAPCFNINVNINNKKHENNMV